MASGWVGMTRTAFNQRSFKLTESKGLHLKVAGMVDGLFTALYDITIKQYTWRQYSAHTITRIVYYTQAFTRQQNASDSYNNVYVCGCHKTAIQYEVRLRVYLRIHQSRKSAPRPHGSIPLSHCFFALSIHETPSHINSLHHYALTPPLQLCTVPRR